MTNLLKKNSPTIGILIVASFFFSSCGKKDGKQGMPGMPGQDQVQTYNVVSVSPQNITLNTSYPATLQGKQSVDIRPKIDGYLQAICVDEGATVKKGQLLFKISSPQYEAAVRNSQAAISSAEAALASAKVEVEKVKPLVAKDIVSKYELESAQLTLKSKEAALNQVRADLATARANLSYTRVTSPANGSIGLIPYKIGSLVSSSSATALTSVSDISTVYAYFSFNEKQLLDFSRTYPGKTLKEKLKHLPAVTLALSDGSAYPEKGKIEVVSGLLDTETGSASFRATFPNPVGLLRSGGSATLQIPTQYTSCIIIPQSATMELQDKRFVYVVKTNNTVASTPITAKASDDGQYFVVTEGLKAGDKIVLEGINLLKDGATIKPKAVAPASIYKNIK